MDKEKIAALVERLRSAEPDDCGNEMRCDEAADALEALAADNAAQAEMVKAQHKRIEELQERVQSAEAKLEAVINEAVGMADDNDEKRYVEKRLRAAIVREVMEGKE